jgi:hypothetical protein
VVSFTYDNPALTKACLITQGHLLHELFIKPAQRRSLLEIENSVERSIPHENLQADSGFFSKFLGKKVKKMPGN